MNPELYSSVLTVITDEDDAKHLTYAVENDCDVFVTLDNQDILPNRAKLEAFCKGMRILKPTQFMAGFSA